MVSEIVHRLIDGEREGFRNGFQRVLNRVPRRGSTTEPSFFPYFFLGSILTLPYTELNDEIGIKASSVKITSDQTLKLAFKIKEDGQKAKLVFRTITTVKNIGDAQHLTTDEFKEALGSLDLTPDELNNCEVEGEIVHIKDGGVSLEKLEVVGERGLNLKILRVVIRDHSPLPRYNEEEARFKKVKDGVIEKGSLNNALEQFSQRSLEVGSGELSPSSKGAEAFFENLSKVYRSEIVFQSDSKEAKDKKLQLSKHEAPAHGFVYGTLAMNFRYEYALHIRPEQAAGKGFVDLVVGSRGHEFRVELKGHKNMAQDAKDQSEREGYDKAPIIFSFGEEQKAESITMIFANLCLDPNSGGLLVEESGVPSKPEGLIELFREHDSQSLKEKLKEKLNYLYYSISDSNGGGKNTNYLSRLILGELLADNTLEKRVFIYEGNHIKPSSAEHDTRSGQVPKDVTIPMNKMIGTFVLKVKDDKYVILNIIEGEDFRIEKSVPLNGLGIDLSKCTQVNIKVNQKANGGFEVEGSPEKSYYQDIEMDKVTTSGSEYYKGEFEKIDHVKLQDITSEIEVKNFKEALFPLRELITLENHFQAILQGLLSAQEGVEVLTEPNYSSRGKPDLLISRREGIAVVELKLASTEKEIGQKEIEGKEQLKKRADGIETITEEGKVEAAVLVVSLKAKSVDEFIKYFKADDLSVEHSSRGSSPQRAPDSPMQGEVSSLDNTVEGQHEISIHQGPDGSISVQPGPSGSQSNSDRSPQHSVLSPIDQNSPPKRLSAEGLRQAATCLPSPPKKPRLSKRAAIGDGCLLDMDEDKKVNKENTGIEINEENFDESKIDNEKLRAYQERIKDEGSEINDQLNKLIIEIQQARAFKDFSDIGKAVKEKLFPALLDVDGISSESANYFKKMCKLNLLRIISPIIKNEGFNGLLFNSPEKLIRNHGLLEYVFASVEDLVSEKYKQQQLRYEDFENLENQVNEEIFNKSEETESIANRDVSKIDLSDYVFESVGLSLSIDQDTEVSTDLQTRIYYETLINLGSLIHDHKNHIQITHNGGHHTPRMNSLVERVKSIKLLSVAYDLYYLRKNKGDVDQSDLYSSKIKNTISLYGSINSEYKLNDIHNKFDIGEFKSYFSEDELKKFGAEFKAYDKEVITIHSTKVFTNSNEVHVKVSDNNDEVKQLIIGSVEGIKNIANYSYNKETLEIKLKLGNGKEYTITYEEEEIDGEVKYYINIEGYKVKVGNIIKSFTNQEKDNIRQKLGKLQDKIELLEIKRDIEVMADIEVSDENCIREVRLNLLAQGVSESTFNKLERRLDYVNEEVFNKYVNGVSNRLTKKNIEFSNSKFDLAKVKGAKGNKLFSIMAIYDLFDSINDVPTLGRYDNDALKKIFGINGILDAMDDVIESISARYIRPDGTVVTKIRPDSGMGKVVSKIPQSMRKAFVRIISNPAVQAITFATIGYQFGHSIDAIVKGDHHPLNYYFATSNGIKLLSMSMKPISMGVSAAVRGLVVTTKALRVVSDVSKVLGKLSVATGVIDSAVTIGINTYEGVEYVKAIASEIHISDGEQLELFIERILNTMPWYQWIIGGRPLSDYYEDAIKVKSYLDGITRAAKEILIEEPKWMGIPFIVVRKGYSSSNKGIAGVVQYVNNIEEKYSEVIKLKEKLSCGVQVIDCNTGETCEFKKEYGNTTFSSITKEVNLTLLDISKVPTLVSSTLGGREVYFIDKNIKHLPYITPEEYNDGLRVISVPRHFRASSPTCGSVINEEYKSDGHVFRTRDNKCNVDKVYRECMQIFTLSEEPLIFTNEQASNSFPILYLSVPSSFIAAANYPAVMHIPKGMVNHKGSEYHDNTFIINYDTHGRIKGGTANNTIVMNYSPSMIFVRLDNGIIDAAGSKIELANIHNYISHSTANQNITTGCKTRYVDAGKGGGNNSIQNYDVYCQDEDYEVRKVNKRDTHLRSIKQTTFIVDKSSGSGASIIRSNNLGSKRNSDAILIKNIDIAKLKINEHKTSYRLELLIDDEEECTAVSVKVDDFEKLVIHLKNVEITEIITMQDKSLPDIIGDMAYQKLNHAGADIDDKIIENSKKGLKAVIIADITNSENTTAYVVARDIAESSNNLGATVSQIGVIKGDTIVNYAVNNLNQIKLITNNGTIISAEKQLEYDRFLFDSIERGKVYLARYFLNNGANVEAKKGNMTPLMSAVFSRRNGEVMIDLLLDRGANIDAKSADNWTAAKWAVYCLREDLVIQLVNRGADIGYRDNINHTLLDTAERLGQRRIADFLRGKQSEEPLKRKRRHHHARHHSGEQKYLQEKERTTYLESKGASHNIENDYSAIKNNQATSGASKPSSWINDLFGWVKDSVVGLFGSKVTLPGKPGNSTVQNLPNISQHNETAKGSSPSSFLSVENVALIGCIADALDNTQSKCYQTSKSQGVNFVPSIQTAVNFARREFDSFVEDKIRNLDSKEKARIRTEVKNAYPEIIESFRRGVEFSGNIGLDDVLEKSKKCFCKNILPNNVSQSESHMLGKTDDKPEARLSDVTVNNQQITGHTK